MYPASVGVAISWPEWNALRPVLINNAALVAFSEYRFRERRDRPLCHLMVRQQTWQGILEFRSVVVGLQMWESRSDFQAWRLCQASCAAH